METTNIQPINYDLAKAQVHVTNQENNKNGLGVAGFVLSLTAAVLCWVPILKWLLLIPALVLSLIGLSYQPRKLAIAGTIISLVVLIIGRLFKAALWASLLGSIAML